MGKESEKEWIYVHVELIQFAILLKLTYHCKSTTCQENLIKKLQVKTMSFYLEKCIVQRIMHGMLKWGQLKNYKDSVSVNSGSSELRISLLELCLSQ